MSKSISALTAKQVIANFPKRPRDSHKGMFGTVVVIGGASGMAGAPLLAARAALKLGAGCVHICLLAENAPKAGNPLSGKPDAELSPPVVDAAQPELMLHNASSALRLQEINVIAIGCGLGTTIAAQKILYEALKRKTALVVDADALNLVARHADLQDDLRNRKAATVLTPHPGEAAHLLACGTQEIQADRAAAAKSIAHKFGCSVVLKGANSLCVTSEGKLFINKTGNPGMSSAGMGDVLTGMIAAFIAQGMSADGAMLLAVHLHGAAADALAEQGITIGMTASEVTEWARWLLNQWI